MSSASRIGDYLLTRELPAPLGERAFAATHRVLPRHARIALPDRHAADVATRLVREACLLEALRHPHVPRMYETGILADRRPWTATELVEGPTLSERIGAGIVPDLEVIALVRAIADILHHAHARGIFHLGLRPAAIVLREGGACLVEWAGARLHDSSRSLAAGVLRDRAYRPPEQTRGERCDGKADIYALGVVAYEALSRSLPTVPAVRRCPNAPANLTRLIDRMLDVRPDARPTAADIRAEALGIAGLYDIPELEPVEQVDVVLVDVAEWIEEAPVPRKLAWTPPHSFPALPTPIATIETRKRRG